MEKNQENITNSNLQQLRDVIERLKKSEQIKETTVITFQFYVDQGFITNIVWDTVIERKYDK